MRGRLDRSDRSDGGISLIEMVVAVLILSIGVIAGFKSLNQSRLVIGGELPRILAHNVALNRAAEWQMQGAAMARGLPGTVESGGIAWQIEVTSEPTLGGFVEARVKVSAEDQPGAIYVVYAPPEPAL
mgnify:CR=1 FL=1